MNSPEIDFNMDSSEFKITGQSILTNVHTFYGKVIAWMEEFATKPPKELVVIFNLNYYNLASAKRFMFMVYILSEMKRKGCKVNIQWMFFKDDDFMREFGQDLSENFDVPFELVPFYNSALIPKLAS